MLSEWIMIVSFGVSIATASYADERSCEAAGQKAIKDFGLSYATPSIRYSCAPRSVPIVCKERNPATNRCVL